MKSRSPVIHGQPAMKQRRITLTHTPMKLVSQSSTQSMDLGVGEDYCESTRLSDNEMSDTLEEVEPQEERVSKGKGFVKKSAQYLKKSVSVSSDSEKLNIQKDGSSSGSSSGPT